MEMFVPQNPFSPNHPHAEIWEMCVRRDLEAFLNADWDLCASDFYSNGFLGWDGTHSADALKWKVSFPSLDS
jgi:hypothetical protein